MIKFHVSVCSLSEGINSEVRYSLMAGDGGYFSLDEFSGVLRLERPLTSETPPSFELKVKATDRGLPRQLYSVATMTVDVVSLDNYEPVFLSSEYHAQLPESVAVGVEVLSVSAPTADGGGPDTVYRIVSGNEDGRFLLDSRTGQCSSSSSCLEPSSSSSAPSPCAIDPAALFHDIKQGSVIKAKRI